ncbi:MAG: hypothetical protein Q9184_003848 [Pyrenodesmia sp. 2 TL-2023]
MHAAYDVNSNTTSFTRMDDLIAPFADTMTSTSSNASIPASRLQTPSSCSSNIIPLSLFWNEGAYQEMDWAGMGGFGEEVTYTHVHGDKESLWLAFEMSGSPYHFHPFYAGIIGVPEPKATPNATKLSARRPIPPATDHRYHPIHSIQPKKPREICFAQALHLDHRNRPLWFNGSLRKNKNLRKSLERLRRPFPAETTMLQAGGEGRQKNTPHTEAEIRILRQGLEMGKSTHWLPGGENWTENGE